MRWYCDCWKECPEDGRFDTTAQAEVSIKINSKGENVTYEYDSSDWDYMVCVNEVHGGCVTCGNCGEEAKIRDN